MCGCAERKDVREMSESSGRRSKTEHESINTEETALTRFAPYCKGKHQAAWSDRESGW